VLKLDARFLFQEKRNFLAAAQSDLLAVTMKNSLKYAKYILVLLLLFLGCVSHAAAQKTIWPSTATPASIDAGANGPVELGVSFKSDVSGYITGVRFYKGVNNTGTHLGHLWSSTGTLLATATFTGENASGWQQVNFSNPVAISANTVYVASYYTQGHWSYDWNYFATSGVDNAPLHALANGNGAANGVYAYGNGTVFPTSTTQANYWVDVAFSPAASAQQTIWPSTATPAVSDVGANGPLELGVSFKSDVSGYITGVRFYKSVNNTGTHLGHLWSSTGTLLASATFTGESTSGWQHVNFSNPVAISANTVYVASYYTTGHWSVDWSYFAGKGADNAPLHALASGNGAGNGVYVYGNGTAFPNATNQANYWVDVAFAPAASAQQTIWPSTATPASIDAGANGPVELGVSFKSDVSGYITGVRFYKGVNNTGTHLGHLWSSTGTLLATATFTGENASGWQQVNFSNPVAISANTVYVASYYTQGHWSYDWNYFATSGVDNAPLHALANGNGAANGVYAYGNGTVFPTSTTQANYWVDVVFNAAGSVAAAPTISTQPGNQTVVAGQSATFAVSAGGSAPLSYQWQKNGVNIAGATSANYTTPATTTTDSGLTFRVVVSNTGGAATSTAATLTVAAAGGPGIQLSSSAVNFGNDPVGTNMSQAVIVTNTGTAALNVTQVTASGSTAFTVGGLSLPMSVSPGQKATIMANFLPASIGTASGSLSMASNASATPTSVALSGSGIAATYTLNVSATSLNFGNVTIGTSSTSQNVAVTNTGNSKVGISQISVSGTGYSVTGGSAPVTLSPSQTLTLTTQFHPTVAGSANGSISIASNATGSPAAVSLSGTGVVAVQHSVTLTWGSSPSTVSGYNIYRSTVNGSSYIKINSSILTRLSYNDASVQSGTTYYYVTTAVDSAGNESSYSNQVSALIP